MRVCQNSLPRWLAVLAPSGRLGPVPCSGYVVAHSSRWFCNSSACLVSAQGGAVVFVALSYPQQYLHIFAFSRLYNKLSKCLRCVLRFAFFSSLVTLFVARRFSLLACSLAVGISVQQCSSRGGG